MPRNILEEPGLKPEYTLEDLGYGSFWQLYPEHNVSESTTNLALARVIASHGSQWRILSRTGENMALISGKLRYNSPVMPLTGDWVLAETAAHAEGPACIQEILPRNNLLSRYGSSAEQGIAANVDYMIIIWPLDKALHEQKIRLGLIHRFITLASSSGMKPIIVFSKADLADHVLQENLCAKATHLWLGVPALCLSTAGYGSALHNLAALEALLPKASTSILVGSSGAGKTSLINCMAGKSLQLAVQEVRDSDAKGRHTTTHRELYVLASGIILMDNPGIRSLALPGDLEALEASFSEISLLAQQCRFGDCLHNEEPGCRVQEALQSGELDVQQLEQWRKHLAEARWQRQREAMEQQRSGSLSWQDKQARDTRKHWEKDIVRQKKGFSKENRS